MNEDRTPQTPPIIKAVTDCESRPRWSVMIPAYNCIGYLQTALESVLIQDPGPEIMQIEVVDDHSTDGDVRALVARVGKGRVGYYRQPYNRGSLRNFETCLNRSKGHLVHLLHGDDAVLPGFYRVTGALFDAHPQVGAAFTSHIVIDECGNQVYSRQSLMDKPGVLSDWLSTIARRQRLQPPAIVVKRLVYEHLGGFFAFHFNEDWEMWVRIAAHYPVAYSPSGLPGTGTIQITLPPVRFYPDRTFWISIRRSISFSIIFRRKKGSHIKDQRENINQFISLTNLISYIMSTGPPMRPCCRPRPLLK
ncbi:glycosyltransferase family 2 protein [Anseongella ginsenosidimutans]|uniref:glycosyltransferase family 2 protein n=1 Tax=Anseongella ginsenosidimutans TaxID=496056 RepID=UPI001CEF688F|nr:glycosyltransferase [Anseongella ginsenosidimutans]